MSVMTRGDKLLIIFLLILGITSYTIVRTLFPLENERTAIIEVKGKEVMRISLSPDLPSRKVPLRIERGEAVFDVSGGKVRVLPMDDRICSKHICSRRGWIERPWEMIVCMPNKISVRIVGSRDGEVDFVTK